MARNIEIKARLSDLEHHRQLAQKMSEQEPEVLHQEDTFFNCEHGRIKLRIESPTKGKVIFYERPDQAGPKESFYLIAETDAPAKVRKILAAAYGIRSIVRKTRHLFMVGRTRIHLDQVDSLGEFLELEVVLDEAEDSVLGEAEARKLMKQLGVVEEQLIEGAYIDLLERKTV